MFKFLALWFLFAPAAYALTLEQAYQQLNQQPIDYTNEGMICEQLMVLELQEILPEHTILRGILYRNSERILGELDVVVFENNQAVSVIEVKCSKSPWRVLAHAKEQLARFQSYLGKDIEIHLADDPDETYEQDMFVDSTKYLAASVAASKQYGFDRVKDIL
jgi:Holliday junction resolvase-like predicted endonuclease